MPILITVPVAQLRKGYNKGKAIGRCAFTPVTCPTYRGEAIRAMDFQRNMIVDYIGLDGKKLARFQDQAAIDD